MRMVWLVVANASVARIYSIDESQDELTLVKELQHPESKLMSHDLVTDRPGHYQTQNPSRGSFVPDTDPKVVEMDKFARELAHEIDMGLQGHHFSVLIIAANPKFHGMLQQHLSGAVQKKIYKVFHKDYTQVTKQELEEIFHSTYRYILADRVWGV